MKAEKLSDVSGQVAIVSGAASGLGLAMAEVMVAITDACEGIMLPCGSAAKPAAACAPALPAKSAGAAANRDFVVA